MNVNNSFSVNNTVSKIVICAALIILALVSFFPLAKRFPDSKLYDGTVKECTASIDEKTAKERQQAQYIIIQASSVDDARDRYKQHINGWLVDVVLEAVSETKYMDYFPYNNN